MNLQADVKTWSGNTHHHPGPRNSSEHSAGKVMLTAFWEFNGPMPLHYRGHGLTAFPHSIQMNALIVFLNMPRLYLSSTLFRVHNS
jgi:hypothetical protein